MAKRGIERMFEDAEKQGPTPDELASIGRQVQRALDLKAELAALAAQTQRVTQEYNEVVERALPEAMDAADCASFEYAHRVDGETTKRKVKLKNAVYASISEANKEPAHKWLRDNNHEDLIKNVITVPLDRGKDNVASEILRSLREDFGVQGERKESVHPSTLKSWCGEQLEAGVDLPADLFGLYIRRVAEIK